jgi:glucokinase
MTKRILAGDIGGTKTLLQTIDMSGSAKDAINIVAEHRFDSQAYDSFDAVVEEFLHQSWADKGQYGIQAACIGVAGPVKGPLAKVTNLPWELNSDALARKFGIAKVRLINDFQAVGYGIEMLDENDIHCLQEGEPQRHATRAVIGAGTGLGHGILIWRQDRYEVYSSEGGHASFAPTDDAQIELLQYLRAKYPNVSYELVCSGPGLENIYDFFRHKNRMASEPAMDAADITHMALEKKDPLAQQALQMFVKIYGSQSGNLALTCLATGGVYVAGGIAPKILPALMQGDFIKAFNDKSKMHDLLKAIPVYIVTNPNVGLLGTLAVAAFHM